VPRLRDRATADRIDAQLLSELAPELQVAHRGNVPSRCA
jgi:hypothetical protein